MTRYRWVEPAPIPDAAYELTDYPLLSVILARRGVADTQGVARFLCPALDQLGGPADLPDLPLAIEHVRSAIARGRPIAIFGDYDVDGLTATSMLARILRRLGASVQTYIPHRERDGYGLNLSAIEQMAADGVALLVTVDCGSSNVAELASARAAGLETVVVDHHHVQADVQLPASAFVSARRPDSRYPFSDLAAVGVTYQLVRALVGDEAAVKMLPFVALGTVADVVPLWGDNRVLVTQGLRRFATDAPAGLGALAANAGLEVRDLTSWDCAYILGPRVNAAGRMADPRLALDLLLTDDWQEAQQLSAELSRLNALRQATLQGILADVDIRLHGRDMESAPLLFLSDHEWAVGLVGLVASRLVEQHHRPAVVLAQGDQVSRGSVRSIAGFNIVEALGECRDLLVAYGGHSKAAGLTVDNGRLDELEQRLGELARAALGQEIPPPTLVLDSDLHPCELTLETEALISQLGPFGHGNPSPRFFIRDVSIWEPRVSRDGKHVMFTARTPDGPAVPCIFFRGGPLLGELQRAGHVDLAFTLKRDRWNGQTRLKLNVLDFRPTARPFPL